MSSNIEKMYEDVVRYAVRLEEILKEQTFIDDDILSELREKYITPATNVVKELPKDER